ESSDFLQRTGAGSTIPDAERVAVVKERTSGEMNLATSNHCGNDCCRRPTIDGDEIRLLFQKKSKREQVPIEILEHGRSHLLLKLFPERPESLDLRDTCCDRDAHSGLEVEMGPEDVAAELTGMQAGE